MPNKDKTGPMGAGPMTGRGFGPCSSAGYGRAMCGWFNRQYQALPKQERREMLEQEIEDLKQELEMVESELKELK